MIKLQVIGNLGKDSILKDVNGKTVINFSVAHTERYKDAAGNQKERTTWVECAYWTDRTAIAPYLKKGTMVFAEGSPEADSYTNKEGQPAATLRMRVQTVQLLGGNKTNEGGGVAPAPAAADSSANAGNVTNRTNTAKPVAEAVDDDLPF
jgi:single-strand DNA-binding protein